MCPFLLMNWWKGETATQETAVDYIQDSKCAEFRHSSSFLPDCQILYFACGGGNGAYVIIIQYSSTSGMTDRPPLYIALLLSFQDGRNTNTVWQSKKSKKGQKKISYVSRGRVLYKNGVWLPRGGDEKSLAINPHGIADDDGSLATVRTSGRGGEEGQKWEWMSVLPTVRTKKWQKQLGPKHSHLSWIFLNCDYCNLLSSPLYFGLQRR